LVAGLDDAAGLQNVDPVRLDIAEQALIVSNQEDRAVGRALLVDAARHRPQRVDVEAAVGLVEDREARLQHRHLEDLVAFLLAAGKTDIDRALQQILADVQELELGAHRPEKLAGVELGLATITALRVERGAQEIHIVYARDLDRVLEGEKQPLARPLLCRHREEVAAEIGHSALGDLIAVTAGEHRGERALAGTVRPHDRVHLVAIHGKVDAAQDLAAIGEPDMQVRYFEHQPKTNGKTESGRPGEGRNPYPPWIPAFAGTTIEGIMPKSALTRRCLRGSRRAASAPRPRIPSAAP